jgi:hypothetical protein
MAGTGGIAMKKYVPMRYLVPFMLMALLVTPESASAQEPQEPAHTKVHRWRVTYFDREIGPVEGSAAVDWAYRRAEVLLRHPLSGAERLLKGRTVNTPGSESVALVVEGASPAAPPVAAPARTMPGVRLEGVPETSVRVDGTDEELDAKTSGRDRPDAEVVTVTLSPRETGELFGSWRYYANPITERNASGGGRVGSFYMLAPGQEPGHDRFGGIQTGWEEWEPLAPEIFFVEVIEDQLDHKRFTQRVRDRDGGREYQVDGAVYPYPDFTRRTERPGIRTRTLLVVGKNLPILFENGEPIGLIDSEIPTVSYRHFATWRDGKPAPGFDDRRWMEQFEKGWRKVTHKLDRELASKVRQLEAVLIDVSLYRDVLPGPKRFTWAGATGTWMLQFGDNHATASFVRRVPDRTERERTPAIFLPEQVWVEVVTERALPLNRLTIQLSRNEKPGPKGVATRVGGADSVLYRTEPFTVARDDPATPADAIKGRLGDTLAAEVVQTVAPFAHPVKAEATLYASPGNVQALWIEYLIRAARLAGKPTDDVTAIQRHRVATVTALIITPPATERRKTDISLANHAGMLLLRDAFVDLMKTQIDTVDKASRDDTKTLGWGELMGRALAADPQSPFGDLKAGQLDGLPVTLADVLDRGKLFKPGALEQRFRNEPERYQGWRLAALRAAMTEYQSMVKKSLDKAEKIKDTEHEELLRLTGYGFEPIVNRVLPNLLKRDPVSQVWQADLLARTAVAGVKDKLQELRDVDAMKSLDRDILVLSAQAVASLPTLFFRGALAALASAALNADIWAVDSAHKIYSLYKTKEEIEFALGASAVLGGTRYAEAKLQDSEWWKTIGQVLFEGVMTSIQGVDTLQQLARFDRELTLARGKALLPSEMEGGILLFRQLKTPAQRDFLALVLEAKAIEQAGGKLSIAQELALNRWTKMAEHAALDIGKLQQAERRMVQIREAIQAAESEIMILQRSYVQLTGRQFVPLRDRLAGFVVRRRLLQNLIAEGGDDPLRLLAYAEADIASLIRPVDAARVERLLAKYDHTWKKIKEAFLAGEISVVDMSRVVRIRKQDADAILKEVLGEVRRRVGGALDPQAFGSTNLTSDYDISIKGYGAELVVAEFNKRFRARYQNLESGYVFDTNVYTDPVYNLFERKALTGQRAGLPADRMDTLRQFMYDQMATRKYVADDAEWLAHKSLMLGAAADAETRRMLEYVFKEAEHAYDSAKRLIAQRLQGLGGVPAGIKSSNVELRATNDTYAEILESIHDWRTEYMRLDGLLVEGARVPPMNNQLLAKYPEYAESVRKLDQLVAARNLNAAKALRNELQLRVAAHLRNRQGLGLYFASEAYQTHATIAHVVYDLQKTKRPITLEKLLGRRVKPSWVDQAGFFNSFHENRANMLKELHHARGASGAFKDPDSAAAKAAKYFIRMIDAAHEAGMDVKRLVGETLMGQTIAIDKVRGSPADVGRYLARAKTDGADFARRVEQASAALAAESVRSGRLQQLGKELRPLFDELDQMLASPGIEEPSLNIINRMP